MRTRTETRHRQVPITRNGKTIIGTEEYQAPAPPRDIDLAVRRAVLAAASLILAASLIWSTASIGDLLSRAVIQAAAYAASGVFDLVWISCTALEWLARHDPARARLPRRAGYAALAVAMAAVGTDGYLSGYLVIGVIGAAVSALAKGLWTVLLASTTTPLDNLTQQWVAAQRAEVGGRLAMIPYQRELARAEATIEAERLALAPVQDSAQDSPGHDPATVRAVRAVRDQVPGLSADQVIEHLTRLGVAHDEDTVHTLMDNATDEQDRDTPRPLRAVPTLTDTIRSALSSGVRDKDAVLSLVHETHGQGVDPASVVRIFNRELARRGA